MTIPYTLAFSLSVPQKHDSQAGRRLLLPAEAGHSEKFRWRPVPLLRVVELSLSLCVCVSVHFPLLSHSLARTHTHAHTFSLLLRLFRFLVSDIYSGHPHVRFHQESRRDMRKERTEQKGGKFVAQIEKEIEKTIKTVLFKLPSTLQCPKSTVMNTPRKKHSLRS